MVIHKTPLYLDGELVVRIQADAKPLSVQNQRGVATVWWLVPDHTAPVEDRFLPCVGTGFIFNKEDVGPYIGTWQDIAGLVWHLFDRKAQ